MDISPYDRDNSRNFLCLSTVPDVCKLKPCVLGIDEAGRGPVLGPMVYGIAYCPVDRNADLKDLGVDDSKQLTEGQRDALLQKIDDNSDYIGYGVHVLSPSFISTSMYRRGKYNLNAMSHDTAIGLVRAAVDDAGVRVAEVYVDTVGPPEKYQAKLEAIFPEMKITVAKKADSLFPCVSAASIAAKVSRDRALKSWTFAEPKDFVGERGSGYPGDATTKKFLVDNIDPVFGFPSIVRFSWKTAEKIIEEKCVGIGFEDVEPEDDDQVKANPSVKDYFVQLPSKSEAKKRASKRHPYFKDRGLASATAF